MTDRLHPRFRRIYVVRFIRSNGDVATRYYSRRWFAEAYAAGCRWYGKDPVIFTAEITEWQEITE